MAIKDAAYNRERRRRARANGRCTRCCTQPAIRGAWCAACRKICADKQRSQYAMTLKKPKRIYRRRISNGFTLAETIARIVHQETPRVREHAKALLKHIDEWMTTNGIPDDDAIRVLWCAADMAHETIWDRKHGGSKCTARCADAEKKTMPNSKPLSTSANAA